MTRKPRSDSSKGDVVEIERTLKLAREGYHSATR